MDVVLADSIFFLSHVTVIGDAVQVPAALVVPRERAKSEAEKMEECFAFPVPNPNVRPLVVVVSQHSVVLTEGLRLRGYADRHQGRKVQK